MAEHPTVTTPGGSDLFASLSSIDYSSFSDESMAMLVEDNLASTTTATPSSTQPLRTELTPGGGNTDNFLMTPRTAEFMAELGGAMATPMNNHQQTHPTTTADARLEMLFDHELVTSGLPSTDALPATTASSEDLPTPLNFSFTPTGSSGGVPRYHAAPTHKHKRVRSNPDMLQGLSFQQLLGNGNTTVSQAGSSPLRPSVDSMASPHHSVSLPTTPMDSNVPMPEPLPISIGTVNVVTPVGFHGGATPGNNGGGEDAFPSDMVSFLKEMQWSELAENNTNSMNMDAMYAQQRGIAGGLNDLKMKRKRPTQHTRHHSNPVDLLHNLDQFRMMSQQQQLQQQQQQPATIDPMPFQPTVKMDQSASMMAPNPFEMPQQGQNMQFQVPSQIANGTARSLHNRRSSMPNSAFARGHARRNTASHSTGLSMDMSQMNLSFLSLPEEEFQQQLHDQRQQQAFQQAMGGGFPPRSNSPLLPQQNSPPQRGSKKAVGGNAFGMEMDSESMRKSYKCGRCGQPKVGHVCTMPELRNNWTQVDLEVTKGTKLLRMNCQIVATKSKWIPQHEDNM